MGQEIKEQKNWFIRHQTKWGDRGDSVSSKLNEPKILNNTLEMRFSAETLNTFLTLLVQWLRLCLPMQGVWV